MFVSLLFWLNTTPRKESAVLAIPESCVDRIITLCHSSIFGGYQGVIKLSLSIDENFFILDLAHYLRAYIKGCHICQLLRNVKPQPRQLQHRINPNYRAMAGLSMDLNAIPRPHKVQKFILVMMDEVTNFVVTIPFYKSRSKEIRDTLIAHLFSNNSTREYMIMVQDSTVMSTLINYLFKKLYIKLNTLGHYNHHLYRQNIELIL